MAPAPAGPGTVYREAFPFLRAAGEGWTLAIDRRQQDGALLATLAWAQGRQRAEGRFRGIGEAYYPERYAGTLDLDGIGRAASLDLRPGACEFDGAEFERLLVTLRIDGGPALAPGCGEFRLPPPP